MDSHIDIIIENKKICICEIEKKISDFLGVHIKFEPDGNLYIYSISKLEKVNEDFFYSFLETIE